MSADLTSRCSHCHAEKPDMVGLSLLETDELEADDFGFCSLACMALFVREHWIEARAAAAPSSVVGPSSTAGGGAGGAQGRSPGSAAVQAPPTSLLAEREATIQRLIAQADDYGRRVAELEAEVRHLRAELAAAKLTFTVAPHRTVGSGW